MTEGRPPLERWIERAKRAVPWVSLAVGLVGAFLMERGPRQGNLVAAATVAVWITLVVLHRATKLERPSVEPLPLAPGAPPPAQPPGWVVKVARLGSLFATQSLVQLALFFAVPFYFQAATWDVGHALFLLLLGGLCVVALWDPWTEWLLTRPVIAAVLPALAAFLALNAVLPGFGISTRASLWLSSVIAAVGIPVSATYGTRREKRRNTLWLAVPVAVLLPCSLWIGGARIIPAAPLRLVRAEMGVARAGKWIREPVERLDGPPAQLICATAIYSPIGVHDELFHVWRKDGRFRARVALEIVGGRKQGYRTQSRLRGFGKDPSGTYRCTVETHTGQVLGAREVVIE